MHVPTILLFGAYGQLGVELARTLSVIGQVVGADPPHCDICDQKALRADIRAINPSLIVNAAAYTGVDKAESEPELAECDRETRNYSTINSSKLLGFDSRIGKEILNCFLVDPAAARIIG